MTTNRMNHTNCSHPKTPAARAACRRTRTAENIAGEQVAAARRPRKSAAAARGEQHAARIRLAAPETQCSQCGSTDPDDVSLAVCDDGYSACCNEPVEMI